MEPLELTVENYQYFLLFMECRKRSLSLYREVTGHLESYFIDIPLFDMQPIKIARQIDIVLLFP